MILSRKIHVVLDKRNGISFKNYYIGWKIRKKELFIIIQS